MLVFVIHCSVMLWCDDDTNRPFDHCDTLLFTLLVQKYDTLPRILSRYFLCCLFDDDGIDVDPHNHYFIVFSADRKHYDATILINWPSILWLGPTTAWYFYHYSLSSVTFWYIWYIAVDVLIDDVKLYLSDHSHLILLLSSSIIDLSIHCWNDDLVLRDWDNHSWWLNAVLYVWSILFLSTLLSISFLMTFRCVVIIWNPCCWPHSHSSCCIPICLLLQMMTQIITIATLLIPLDAILWWKY